MQERRNWFLVGLFLTTLVTLCLEVLATRLLSVMTWYHLSFFAVSTAMFGMSAGALQVYLGGDRFRGEDAPRALVRYGAFFAILIPLCHMALLTVPVPVGFSMHGIAVLLVITILLAIPFYFSGILVAIALTRIPGKIGLFYAVDLVGASLGSLLVLPLLEFGDISSAHLWCAALMALAVCCYRVFAGMKHSLVTIGLVIVFGIGAVANSIARPEISPADEASAAAGADALARRDANPHARKRLAVWFSKGKKIIQENVTHEFWNIHAQLLVRIANPNPPQYWGKGEGAPTMNVERRRMVLDGDAGTVMTGWDQDPKKLGWVKYDVTSMPYHLRKGGDCAVIGVGGGRDILTALWSKCTSVRGVEINGNFIDLLEGDLRDFANIANQPQVELIHDEARSYFTRHDEQYDVLQMSLIDTWAATGAGAFTLTENGLYTLDAWKVFLDRLKPTGFFSVSRWYAPENASETNRLLALGVASLLERGVERPSDHMALITRFRVGTLMVSPSPLSPDDITRIHSTATQLGFGVLAAPDVVPGEEQMAAIFSATSPEALAVATEHELFDYTPPTDERPYFFNILKPGHAFDLFDIINEENTAGTGGEAAVGALKDTRGVSAGNLVATTTLLLLGIISLALVLTVILGPLTKRGLPSMAPMGFLFSVLYFSSIGLGFMLVQIAFMQRFSVYLGHPTHSVVIILFSMILATGLGSFLSDRLPVERSKVIVFLFPIAIGGALLLEMKSLQPLIDSTIEYGLFARASLVVAVVTPVSVLLGLCFPIGLRLVQRLSSDAMPWMWGVNGACGVLGAVLAVGISMWAGITASLFAASLLYFSIALYALILASLHPRQEAEPAVELEPEEEAAVAE